MTFVLHACSWQQGPCIADKAATETCAALAPTCALKAVDGTTRSLCLALTLMIEPRCLCTAADPGTSCCSADRAPTAGKTEAIRMHAGACLHSGDPYGRRFKPSCWSAPATALGSSGMGHAQAVQRPASLQLTASLPPRASSLGHLLESRARSFASRTFDSSMIASGTDCSATSSDAGRVSLWSASSS